MPYLSAFIPLKTLSLAGSSSHAPPKPVCLSVYCYLTQTSLEWNTLEVYFYKQGMTYVPARKIPVVWADHLFSCIHIKLATPSHMCHSPTRQGIHFRDIHLKYFGILHSLLLSFFARLHNFHQRSTAWTIIYWIKKNKFYAPVIPETAEFTREVSIHAVVSKDTELTAIRTRMSLTFICKV